MLKFVFVAFRGSIRIDFSRQILLATPEEAVFLKCQGDTQNAQQRYFEFHALMLQRSHQGKKQCARNVVIGDLEGFEIDAVDTA